MSNIICIQPCKFVDYEDSKNVTSYGYRCFDDYGCSYNNLWKKKHINMSPIKIFEKACEGRKDDLNLDIALNYIERIKGHVLIGNTDLEWKQIKDIIKK